MSPELRESFWKDITERKVYLLITEFKLCIFYKSIEMNMSNM